MLSVIDEFKSLTKSKRWMAALIATTLVIAVWIFVEMADDALEGKYLVREENFLRSLRHNEDVTLPIGPVWLPEAARDITSLGSASVLTLVTALVLGFLLLRQRYRTSLLVLAAIVTGYSLSTGFKMIFARPRPSVINHLTHETSTSFPSGHSMVSSVVYLTLGALLAQTVAHRREKAYLIYAALLLAFIVGLSRMYLGVHYPTDVIAGWAAGIAWAIICWTAAYLLQRQGKIATPDEPTRE